MTEAMTEAETRTLGRVLREQAQSRPDRAFVLSGDARWTFAEVDALADRYAAGLAGLGVGQGDTVALLVDSCVELLPLTFGINRLGAIWVPTNTDYKGQWLRQSLEDSRARVLVVDASLVERVTAAMSPDMPFEHVVIRPDGVPGAENWGDGTAGLVVHELGDLAAAAATFVEVPGRTGDTAAVLWTSGTTGRAKGVMQSHNAWIRAALTGAASSRTSDDDVLYCCLPLYNSAAWIGTIYRALVAGVPVALDPRFSVGSFWDRTRHYGATQAFLLGAMHMFLWQAEEQDDDADNPVRCLGAIPMPDRLIDPFRQRFGIDIIQQGYGQSEVMGLISRFDDGTTTWNPGAAGKPLPGIEVRILDDGDNEVAPGTVGEICVRPTEPNVVFNGYFNDPHATLAACRNLWYHTGDLGKVDGDGQYHFVDRKKDYIRHKGRSVSSFAVEAAVRAHGAVAEVAAFGVVADELDSEAEVMVAVVCRPGVEITPDELARFVNDTAPYFFVPRYIDVVDELPYTPTGKVQKFELRDRGVTATTWDREAAGFELVR